MKTLNTLFMLSFLLLSACYGRYSPWETDVPAKYQNLTEKNLLKLAQQPAPSEGPLTIAIIADPQGTPEDFKEVARRINGHSDVSFTLVLGDMTDYGLLHEFLWAAEALEKLEKPYFTVIGNHDSISHGPKIYQTMFGPLDYDFSYAGIKFVMFNDNQFEFGTTDFSSYTSRLDSNTIVGSHVPPVVDMHTQEQVDQWYAINQSANILASIHGYRGTKKGFYWKRDVIPYYVFARARGVRYGIIQIYPDRSIRFYDCKTSCQENVDYEQI